MGSQFHHIRPSSPRSTEQLLELRERRRTLKVVVRQHDETPGPSSLLEKLLELRGATNFHIDGCHVRQGGLPQTRSGRVIEERRPTLCRAAYRGQQRATGTGERPRHRLYASGIGPSKLIDPKFHEVDARPYRPTSAAYIVLHR